MYSLQASSGRFVGKETNGPLKADRDADTAFTLIRHVYDPGAIGFFYMTWAEVPAKIRITGQGLLTCNSPQTFYGTNINFWTTRTCEHRADFFIVN